MQTNTSTRIFYVFQEINLYWRVCGCEKARGKGKGREKKRRRGKKERRNYIEDKIWTWT